MGLPSLARSLRSDQRNSTTSTERECLWTPKKETGGSGHMDLRQTSCFMPLALVAMRELNAEGFAIYQYERGRSGAVIVCEHGLPVPRDPQESTSVARVPLHWQNREVGWLAFVFRGSTVPDNAWRAIERLAWMVESISSLFAPPQRAVDLIMNISRRQAELADLKIAERAQGFLEHPEPRAAETLALHVENVLRSRRFEAELDQLARELDDQMEERRIIAEAKALLQTRQGITEEEAYAQLRLSSRRSRRRIFEVAHKVVAEHHDTHA
ncbi:MAG: hypothetical protein C5B51_04625 [Terriglobia bacterium]|nr:MAG: hypothetical protein C5B51_04625 [Terriglobia bacterium]